jgi:hypothetical protein
LKDSQTQDLIWISYVDQMMRNVHPVFVGGFCSADIHTAIKKPRIRRDYFSVDPCRELDGCFCLANRCWTDD